MRGDCTFCWYLWTCWPSLLFPLSHHNCSKCVYLQRLFHIQDTCSFANSSARPDNHLLFPDTDTKSCFQMSVCLFCLGIFPSILTLKVVNRASTHISCVRLVVRSQHPCPFGFPCPLCGIHGGGNPDKYTELTLKTRSCACVGNNRWLFGARN
jgi:hypothetical protein